MKVRFRRREYQQFGREDVPNGQPDVFTIPVPEEHRSRIEQMLTPPPTDSPRHILVDWDVELVDDEGNVLNPNTSASASKQV